MAYTRLNRNGQEVVSYSMVETASFIRARLKACFPGVKFSVRSGNSAIAIRWTDGPTENEVKEAIEDYRCGYDDSDLITSYYGKRGMTHYVDGQLVKYHSGPRGLPFFERNYSIGFLRKMAGVEGFPHFPIDPTTEYEGARLHMEVTDSRETDNTRQRIYNRAKRTSDYYGPTWQEIGCELPPLMYDQPQPAEVPIEEIRLERAEGLTRECVGVSAYSWQQANAFLQAMAYTASERGYHKVDYIIYWQDGKSYHDTFLLKRQHVDGADIAEEARTKILFYGGKYRPDNMTDEQYSDYMNTHNHDNEKALANGHDLGGAQ